MVPEEVHGTVGRVTPRPRRGAVPRRRVPLSVLLAVLVVVPLAGCGDRREAYCEQLRKDQSALGEIIGSSTPGALITGLPTLEQVGAKAPPDLTDEWQTFLNAVQGLSDALDDAGLQPSQVRGGLPKTLSAADRSAVSGAASVLTSEDVVAAADGIETQARDVCKVNLGL